MSDEWNWNQNPPSPAGPSAASEGGESADSDVTYHYKFERGSEHAYHYGPGSSQARSRQEDESGTKGDEAPRYAHYQLHQGQTAGAQPEAPGKGKSEGGFGKRAGAVLTLGLLFGLAAGVAFQGVALISQKYFGTARQSTVATTEKVPAADSQEEAAQEEDLGQIASERGTVAAVAQATMPCVVAITSVSMQEIQSFFGYGMEYPSTGSGSGIIVGENEEELLIATNHHVVEGATTLNVCFIGDDVVSAEQETQSYLSGDGDLNIEDAVAAKIKGSDEDNDLAVIAVKKEDIPEDTLGEIKIAQLGSSDSLVVGEQVVAIGNALGYGQTVTSGWVSALDRTVTLESGSASDLIQTDAAINPGNSGGALLNMYGELIGINCAKYTGSTVEGTGYAIPISKAQPILEELMNRKTRDKVEDESRAGYLGVQVADLSVEAVQMYNMPSGAFVIEVTKGKGADAAGIQKNDIIVKLDGQKVGGKADLIDKLQYYAAGEDVDVVIARADSGRYQEQTLTVTLSARQ
ncbi:MAG: trypsin-like peptidase domain-containing protein [Eubacteriales bacterium]|nr:trypsin-like peptidase domain-containing protein [Eubacteriales bacterium]